MRVVLVGLLALTYLASSTWANEAEEKDGKGCQSVGGSCLSDPATDTMSQTELQDCPAGTLCFIDLSERVRRSELREQIDRGEMVKKIIKKKGVRKVGERRREETDEGKENKKHKNKKDKKRKQIKSTSRKSKSEVEKEVRRRRKEKTSRRKGMLVEDKDELIEGKVREIGPATRMRKKGCKPKKSCRGKGRCKKRCKGNETVIANGCKGKKYCQCCVRGCKTKKRCEGTCRKKCEVWETEKSVRKGCKGDGCVCCVKKEVVPVIPKPKPEPQPQPQPECKNADHCTQHKGTCKPRCEQTESVVVGACEGRSCFCCVEEKEIGCPRSQFCPGECTTSCKNVVANVTCPGLNCLCCLKCSLSIQCRERRGSCKADCACGEEEMPGGCTGAGCKCCIPHVDECNGNCGSGECIYTPLCKEESVVVGGGCSGGPGCGCCGPK
ncbi:hypothetical protein Pcinc_022436 [Petrolisthes cinctipes]|uniref:Uncharacterized protein n=1 Tax=Petrolisthes cinctipes TaxID=88211 RepID=A0AAE1FEL7_PETCI|nr:hypothetical protein Pcinc_022436 [Petrolisthes cinctipes]